MYRVRIRFSFSQDCSVLGDCTHIQCDIKQLKDGEYVLVEVFARLWVNTLIDRSYVEANISSLAIAKVSSLALGPKGYSPPAQTNIVMLPSAPRMPQG